MRLVRTYISPNISHFCTSLKPSFNMQSLLQLAYLFSILYSAINAVVLKSSMTNNYPQIAVLGCDSRKVNLFYDIEKKVWAEHLISSCVHNEQDILEFCQQAYPNLPIGNIVRLETVLRFDSWCELASPDDSFNGDNIRRCKLSKSVEEVVQPFRCLYMNSQREEIHLPSNECTMNSIIGTGECLRPEKWQQLASIECANKSMNLNNSIMTLDWCGLSSFRGIEFVCCPIKKSLENDYETSLDESLLEDDPIDEGTTTTPAHRRIIAMSLASREPSWIEDYRRWNSDPAYFADDEDTNDYQPLPVPQTKEQQRFAKDKEDFKQKYKQQFDQLKSRWQTRQKDVQLLSIRNRTAADEQRQSIDIQFQREYEQLKQSASQERTRLNELHETHLDLALNSAKIDANKNLINAWNEQPLKTENIQKALYNYVQLFLNDRIHLVNRYERLRAVDPEQAERKRISIHERLRLIVNRINDALNQLKFYPNLQTKIQPNIDKLFLEYEEVNQAAEKLLKEYDSTSTTTRRTRILPFGRDENKIYPFTISSTTNKAYDDTNLEYDYATNDEYDEDDENGNDEKDKTSTTVSTTTKAASDSDGFNYDQIETGDSDWDVNIDDDKDDDDDDNDASSFDVKFDDQNQQAFINENDFRPIKTVKQNPFVTYLPYASACLLVISIAIGLIIFRCIKRHRSYQNLYEKNYHFAEVESCTPEEKALHTLQMNGYENPTYRFFEGQSPKC